MRRECVRGGGHLSPLPAGGVVRAGRGSQRTLLLVNTVFMDVRPKVEILYRYCIVLRGGNLSENRGSCAIGELGRKDPQRPRRTGRQMVTDGEDMGKVR